MYTYLVNAHRTHTVNGLLPHEVGQYINSDTLWSCEIVYGSLRRITSSGYTCNFTNTTNIYRKGSKIAINYVILTIRFLPLHAPKKLDTKSLLQIR